MRKTALWPASEASHGRAGRSPTDLLEKLSDFSVVRPNARNDDLDAAELVAARTV
jgi:hypothetical protein